MPEAVPGAAVSPGSRIWSLLKAPALIVVDGLVLAVIAPFVMSVEVKVAEPAVLAVTENVLVPATSAVLAGSVAFGSVEVMPTVSVEVTTFQLASTALTVTVNAPPAVWADGAPVLPVAVPGAAVSPGMSSWSFVKAPALIVVDGAGVGGHRAVGDVGCGEGRAAGGLRGDREGLGARDERGVGRAAWRSRRWR